MELKSYQRRDPRLLMNQRKEPRFSINRPSRIRVGDGPEERSQLVDISETGAMVFYSRPIKLGAAIELRFSLDTSGQTECTAYGEVRHYSVHGTSHVVGIEFTHFVPETIEAIRQYIRQRGPSASTTAPHDGTTLSVPT